MLKITNDNYEQYKKIAGVLWHYQFKNFSPTILSEEVMPMNRLIKWEQKNRPLAKSGLKAGLLDSLSLLQEAPEKYLEELNKELLEAGLPSLALLMTIINDVPAKVLTRGKIRNIQEAYIIKEMLDATDATLIPVDRLKLGQLFFDFENSRRKH